MEERIKEMKRREEIGRRKRGGKHSSAIFPREIRYKKSMSIHTNIP